MSRYYNWVEDFTNNYNVLPLRFCFKKNVKQNNLPEWVNRILVFPVVIYFKKVDLSNVCASNIFMPICDVPSLSFIFNTLTSVCSSWDIVAIYNSTHGHLFYTFYAILLNKKYMRQSYLCNKYYAMHVKNISKSLFCCHIFSFIK